jgi:hypothetical protein
MESTRLFVAPDITSRKNPEFYKCHAPLQFRGYWFYFKSHLVLDDCNATFAGYIYYFSFKVTCIASGRYM